MSLHHGIKDSGCIAPKPLQSDQHSIPGGSNASSKPPASKATHSKRRRSIFSGMSSAPSAGNATTPAAVAAVAIQSRIARSPKPTAVAGSQILATTMLEELFTQQPENGTGLGKRKQTSTVALADISNKKVGGTATGAASGQIKQEMKPPDYMVKPEDEHDQREQITKLQALLELSKKRITKRDEEVRCLKQCVERLKEQQQQQQQQDKQLQKEQALQGELHQVSSKNDLLLEANKKLQLQVSVLSAEKDQLHQQVNELHTQAEQLQSELTTQQHQHQSDLQYHLEQQRDTLQSDHQKLHMGLQELQEQTAQQLVSLQNQLDQNKAQLNQAAQQQQAERSRLQEEVNRLQHLLDGNSASSAKLKSQLAEQNSRAAALSQQHLQETELVQQLRQELEQEKATTGQLHQSLADQQATTAQLQQERASSVAVAGANAARAAELQAQLAELEAKHAVDYNKLLAKAHHNEKVLRNRLAEAHKCLEDTRARLKEGQDPLQRSGFDAEAKIQDLQAQLEEAVAQIHQAQALAVARSQSADAHHQQALASVQQELASSKHQVQRLKGLVRALMNQSHGAVQRHQQQSSTSNLTIAASWRKSAVMHGGCQT